MHSIKLQGLRCFVAVYEEGSISAAARKVHATQSGVSVQIRDLEYQLGVALFERISSGVTPTKAGERIYQRAVRILRDVSGLGEDIAALSDSLTGKIRVGIMPTFARSILAPVLTGFSEANPLVEVTVTEGYSALLTRMVLAGDLDFAVVPDGALPDGLASTLVDTDLELLASSRPLDGVGNVADLATLPALKLVLPGPSNARRAKIDQHLTNVSGAVHDVLELDSMMATLDMVRRGERMAILPGCLCLADLEDPDIALYPIENPRMTVDYLLIEPAARTMSVAVQRFAEHLANEIRLSCETCRSRFYGGWDARRIAKG